MTSKRLKKATPASGQRTLQDTLSSWQPPTPAAQQRSKKRKAGDEPIVLSSGEEEPVRAFPQ